MAERAITEDTFGAWLVKCSPPTGSTLQEGMDAGTIDISRWCVVPGYRADMMRKGQRVVLWVSGGDKAQRGIWATGRLTGEACVDEAHPAAGLSVPVDLRLLTDPLSADEIVAAGMDHLEVQRMPAGSNPSWISRGQLEVLDALLGEPWGE
jgi:hypothetical protein